LNPKKVSESSVIFRQLMSPQDANIAGNVHGGVIMKAIDNAAGVATIRHCRTNAVTASIDQLDFHSPVFIGDILTIKASLNLVGTSSCEVGVRVEAETVITGEIRHVASAYLTFVSLDENLKPKIMPPLVFETDDEKRRNREAILRKKIRLAEKKQIRACSENPSEC
jgi:acyl-CoA hydrolase